MNSPARIPVLMVDDRPENLVALEALLGELPLPLDLVKAGSGQEALRLSLKQGFAVVLLDVQMPDMDGLETAMLLRANPKTRHLPIIFVTAGMHDNVRQFKGYESGAVDFLNKPIEPLFLRSKVAVFCELFAKCRELEASKATLEEQVRERTAALRDSEARLHSLIDSARDAFASIDGAGIVSEWNRQAEVLTGYARGEVLGQPLAQVLGVPAMCTGTSELLELEARHRNGHIVPIELSWWQVPQSVPPLFGALMRDISERRQLDEARSCQLRQAMDQIVETEKLAALGSLVASVAHELNTPVGNMGLMATTIRDRMVELSKAAAAGRLTRSMLADAVEQCSHASEVLSHSGTRACELIESFKNVAVDQTSQRRRRFDLLECVGDIFTTLASILRRARVATRIAIPDGIIMDSYPGHLEQVINNLVLNSILHGFEGRSDGVVALSARQLGGQVEIVYEDNGAGIAPELQHRVFEPFYTTRLGQGGSGLGMFIVQNLALGILGGQLGLESALGTGVRVTLTLPLACDSG
ncbi:MAG: ATP-binding protein [Pseudomonadota bacterium]